jgi:hypothetical protein
MNNHERVEDMCCCKQLRSVQFSMYWQRCALTALEMIAAQRVAGIL